MCEQIRHFHGRTPKTENDYNIKLTGMNNSKAFERLWQKIDTWPMYQFSVVIF